MSGETRFWDKPGWLFLLLLPLFHYASIRLTFLCAVTPENEVVVWLPNAVLLAALLRFRGRRGWLMAILTFTSDVIGNLPQFPRDEAVLLSLVNLVEVVSTYLLMRSTGVSSRLERIEDLTKFLLAGPVLSALFAGILGAAVIEMMEGSAASYFTLMRLWWFGDALGLLIYTPLLLAFSQPPAERIRWRWQNVVVVLLTLALAGLIFSSPDGEFGGASLTPTVLLPFVLAMAARLERRWTALAVALISLATAYVLAGGHNPFGDAAVYSRIVRAQEFIMTLSIVGMGFAVLLDERKIKERELELKVRERTQELEESNSKLATLSATDGLTGIANRRRFDEVLAREWGRARRAGEPLALALLDVDWFKKYNDHYGHQSGDDCLRAVARVLQANIRRSVDLVARYGGEEFAIIAPATGEASARRIASTIAQALAEAGLPHATSAFGVVSVSIGVAVLVPTAVMTSETLVTQADAALYQAKERGRNRVVVAEPVAT
ncbi:MAG TPA: diguanylate cyclase [Dongiaceae bacterium]|jgi:diguanylate cyclase (GGDEF)-like protein